jgi:hypothetical protein
MTSAISENISFIIVWNVAGELHSPKYVYYHGFKGSSVSSKGGFPFMTFFDVNIVVSPLEIYLGEPL